MANQYTAKNNVETVQKLLRQVNEAVILLKDKKLTKKVGKVEKHVTKKLAKAMKKVSKKTVTSAT